MNCLAVLCVLCGGFVEDALKLKCGHLCCRKCADVGSKRALCKEVSCGTAREEALEVTRRAVVCGECDTVTAVAEMVPDGGASAAAIGALRERKVAGRRCSAIGCEETAVVRCATCGYLCGTHSESVHSIVAHKVVELQMGVVRDDDLFADLFKEGLCREHPDECRMFCCECEKVFCLKCHACECLVKGHRTKAFDEEGEESKMAKALLENVRERLADLDEELAKDRNQYFEDWIETIHGEYGKVHKHLEDEENAVVEQIRKIKSDSAAMHEDLKKAMAEVAEEHEMKCKFYENLGKFDNTGKRMKHFQEQLLGFEDECLKIIASLKKLRVDLTARKDYARVTEKPLVVIKKEVIGAVERKEAQLYLDLEDVKNLIAFDAGIDVGFEVANGRGVAFDAKRRYLFDNRVDDGMGQSVYVTRLRGRKPKTVQIENVIPFKTYIAPIFDEDRSVFYCEADGVRFGRLDSELLDFEELPSAPCPINMFVNGFFAEGCVYVFGTDERGLKYNISTGEWSESPLKSVIDYGCHYLIHPWDSGRALNVMPDGSLRELRLRDGAVLKEYKSRFPDHKNIPELLALRAPENEFILFMCSGFEKTPWRVFLSSEDRWVDADWPSTQIYSNSAFFDPGTRTLYYHENTRETWTMVEFHSEKIKL